MLVSGALVALFMLFLTKLYDFGYEYTKQKYEVASLKG
jgi:hypothetical protein